MFSDYHVHTEYSDASVYPMEDVIQAVKVYKNYSVLGHMALIKRYDKAGISQSVTYLF